MKNTKSLRERHRQQFAAKCKLLAAALSVAAGLSASAEGGTDSWIAGSDFWSTPGDWSPSGVPANGDDVMIDPNATINITFDGNYTGSGLNTLTLDDSNGTATLTQSINSLVVSGTEYVGYSGNGIFTQSAGNNTIGSSAAFNTYGGAGGYQATSDGLFVGDNSSALGTYTMSSGNGSSPTLNVYGNEYVGYSATGTGSGGSFQAGGTFDQSAGTHNVYGLNLEVAVEAGSTGQFNLSGGSLTFAGDPLGNYETIGDSGTGTFVQSGGNHTIGSANGVGVLSVGNASSGVGTYTMNNASGSTPTLSVYGNEYVGVNGTGTFTQSAGNNTIGSSAAFNTYGGAGGYQATSDGLFVGDNSSALGTYTMSSGNGSSPTLNVYGNEYVGYSATGTGSGGSFQAGGTFNQSAGTHNVYGLNLEVAVEAGSTGQFNLSGGSLTFAGDSLGNYETIGDSGTGTFVQSGGNHTIGSANGVGVLSVGNASSGVGTYTMNNASGSTPTLSVYGNEYVGVNGTGTFTQSAGNNTIGSSAAFNTYGGAGGYQATSDGLFVGDNSSALGTYTMSSGNGSSPTLNVYGNEYVGYSATGTGSGGSFQAGGTFNQSAGTHNVYGLNLEVAVEAGSTGQFNLSGGSLTFAGDPLGNYETIGDSGTGTFVQSGGNHTIGSANGVGVLSVGNASSGVGTYTMNNASGSTPTLSVYGNEYVGVNGTGTFTQSAGTNSAGTLYLGSNSGSSGNYTLSAGTLTISGTEDIGVAGNGTFIQSGGTNSTGTILVGSGSGNGSPRSGSYQMTGGTLSTGYAYVGDFGAGSVSQFGNSAATIGGLFVGYGNGDVSGTPTASYTLGGNSSLTVNGYYDWVGYVGNGNFTQSGNSTHTVNGGYLQIGGASYGSGYSAIYNLQGGTLTSLNGIYVEYGGTLNQTGGVIDGTIYVNGGNFSGTLVNGDSLTFDGGSFNATQNGGSATFPGNLIVAPASEGGATTAYVMNGGTLSTPNYAFVGYFGAGSVAQSGNSAATVGGLFVGYGNGDVSGTPTATYTLGGNASLTVNGYYDWVGYAGNGNFTQSGNSTHTINGGFLQIGGYSYGSGYSAVYNLQGGTLSSANGIYVDSGGTLNRTGGVIDGTIYVNGGNFTGSLVNGDSLTFNGGSFNATQNGGSATFPGNLIVAPASEGGATTAYVMNGGTLSASGAYVGYFGAGSLTQSGNSAATVGGLFVGYGNGDVSGTPTATYTLSGNASLTVNGYYDLVGYAGNGNFTQSGNSTHTVNGGYLQIGGASYGSGYSAIYNLQGGTLTSLNGIYVDYGGTLNQTGGVINGPVYIYGGNVTGTLENGNSLTFGSGTFNATQNGGSVTFAGYMLIGPAAYGAATTAYVMNGGTLSAPYGMYDGYFGAGSMTQGGNSTATVGSDLFVGYVNGNTTATYALSDNGNLTVNGYEYIGYFGNGNLTQSGNSTNTINNAGIVIGGNGYAASYNLQGGTLWSPNGIYVDGGGTINQTGGVIDGPTYIYGGGTLQLTSGGSAAIGNVTLYSGTLQLRSDSSATMGIGNTTLYDSSAIDVDSVTAGNPSQTLSLGTLNTQQDGNVTTQLNVTGSVNSGNRYTLAVGNVTLDANTTFNPTTADLSLGNITGSGYTLTKIGGGTLSLTGSSTSTNVSVNGGRVNLLGSLTGGVIVTVASGATFSAQPGSGTNNLTGLLTLNAGSSFDMVDGGIGTFNINQAGTSLIIGSGSGSSALTFEIGNGTLGTDQIHATGTISIGGTGGQIAIAPLAGDTAITPGNYTLIQSTQLTLGSGSALTLRTQTLTVDGNVYNLSLSQSNNSELLTVVAGTYDTGQDFILAPTAGQPQSYSLGSGPSLSGYRNEYIGYNDVGTFTQSGDSNTASGAIILGVNAGSTGNYTLSSGTLSEDAMLVSQQGVGIFTQTGGTHQITNTLTIGSQGTYTLQGGSLSAASVVVNGGTFNQDANNASLVTSSFVLNGGTHNVINSSTLEIDAVQIANYTLNSGTLSAPYVMEIGISGAGNLTQSGGAVSVGTGYIGVNSGGSGVYNLSGNGTFATTFDFIIGRSGTGVLNQSGGNMTVGGTHDGTTEWVGLDSGGVGTVNLSGNATHNTSDLEVGHYAGSSGTYTLSGNASLHVYQVPGFGSTGGEDVGYNGTGSFTQNSGTTHIVDGALAVGSEPGGFGTYQMNGGTLSTGGSELIGFDGNGTFTQAGGNNTTAQAIDMGHYAGGSGTYNLSGGNLTAGGLYDGQYGKAVFNQSGGTLNLSVVSYIYSDDPGGGTYNLSGGTINTGIIVNVGRWAGSPTFAGTGFGAVNQTGGNFNVNAEQVLVETLGSYSLTGNGTLNSVGFDSGLIVDGTFHQSGAATTASFAGGLIVSTGNGTSGSAGGSLTIDSGNFTCLSSCTATIGQLGGNGTFTQNGGFTSFGGNLTVAADGNSTGLFTLNGGNMSLGGTIVIGAGGRVDLEGGNLYVDAKIVNNGSFYQSPNASVILDPDTTGTGTTELAGPVTIAADSTFNGGYTVLIDSTAGVTASGTGYLAFGNSSGSATYNQTGGDVELGAVGLALGNDGVGNGSGTGYANISAGTLNVANLLLGSSGSGVGIYSQSGGTVTASSLVVHGGSTVSLTGGTLNTANTQVSHGATFTVGGGATLATLNLMGGTHTFTDGLILGSNSQLTGSGTVSGNLTIGSGASIAPGAGPAPGSLIAPVGVQTTVGLLATDGQTWNGGGAYRWKLNTDASAGGAAGNSTAGWDLITMSALTVNATQANPFTLSISSAGNNNAGFAATGFDPAGNSSWTIAQISSAVVIGSTSEPTSSGTVIPLTATGSDLFALDTSDFAIANPNTNASGFQLDLVGDGSGGDDLVLVYSATPEPGTTLLIGAGIAPVLLARRRRHCRAASQKSG